MGAQPRQMQFTNVVCIGAGNIGAGWVAQFLIAGLDVVVYDPAPEREAWLDEYLVRAMPNLERLGLAPVADTSLVRSTSGLEDADPNRLRRSGPQVFGHQMGRSLSKRALRKTWKARLALWSGSRTLRRSRAIVASSSAGFLPSIRCRRSDVSFYVPSERDHLAPVAL